MHPDYYTQQVAPLFLQQVAPVVSDTDDDRPTSLLVESDGYVLGELHAAYPRVRRHHTRRPRENPVGEEQRRGQELCVGLDRSLLEVVGVGLISCEGVNGGHTLFWADCAGCLRTFKWEKKWKECDRRCET